MLDITDFSPVFAFDPKFSFSNSSQTQISSNRQSLGGLLFLDRLLEVLQVKCKSYPPTSNKDLRELHRSIVDASIGAHHKHSLLYYILLDCYAHTTPSSRSRRGGSDRHASAVSSTPGESPAKTFARQVHLSQKYGYAIQGLWNMDRRQFKPALDYLTHPSLLPTFPEAVLQALLANGQHNLAIAYLNTMGSTFNVAGLEEVYSTFFKMLADSGIADAYVYLQQLPVTDKRGLFEMLIESALRTPVKSGKHGADAKMARCSQLVDLPFSGEEAEWLEDFLLRGDGRSLEGAKLTVAMRFTAVGRVKEAKELTADMKPPVIIIDGQEVKGPSFPEILNEMEQSMGEAARIDALWHGELVYG